MTLLLTLLFSISAFGETLKMNLPIQPVTLDWTGGVNVSYAPLVVNLCEGLFSFDQKTSKLSPAIAVSVQKSKDLKEYTFKINETAKWSDGRPIYAKDFVDGWQRILSPQTTSIYYYYLFDIENAREYHEKKIKSFDEVGIHAVNDRTLVVRFKSAQTEWEATTAFWPLFPIRKDLIEKFGNNWWVAGTLVSSGPFILSSQETGKKAILKRNPYYKKTSSNVDMIEIDFNSNQEVTMEKFKKKEYPFLTDINIEKAIKEKEFKPIPLLRHYVIALNTNRFPFNNPNFRLAILSSINPKEILPKDSKQFSLANAMIPPALFSTKEETAVSFDPVKANEYLKKSGVILNKSVKIEFLSGIAEPFASISKKIAEQIEKNINVPVKLLIMSTKEFETYSNLGEYSMMMISWTAKARTAKDFLLPYSGYYSSNNRAKHTNEEYDQAIINNDLGKAQKIISKQTGVIQPLFFEKSGYLSHKTIKNLQFDHIGLPILKDVVLLKK